MVRIDSNTLQSFADDLGIDTSMIDATDKMNENMKHKYGENTEKYVWN